MDSSSLNTIIGIIAGIVSILTGVVALMQTAKTKKLNEAIDAEGNTHSVKSKGETKKAVPKSPRPQDSSSPPVAPVPGVTTFVGDDPAYKKWLDNNPQGFVINTARKPNPEYMALHKASCSHVSNFAIREKGAFTGRDYIKVASTDLNSLREWAKAHGRPDGTFTGNCTCKPQ